MRFDEGIKYTFTEIVQILFLARVAKIDLIADCDCGKIFVTPAYLRCAQ